MKGLLIPFLTSSFVVPTGCSTRRDPPSSSREAPAVDGTASTRPAIALTGRGELLPVGAIAPDFLVFYPKDFTPGCTRQLCAIRDDWSQFEARNIVVAGVNPGSVEEHKRFAEHHGFPFPVLSDPHQRVAAAYGCKGTSGLPSRTVYGIDAEGRVALARSGMPATSEILAAVAR